jgi:sec-independent protein translocase protein TatA
MGAWSVSHWLVVLVVILIVFGAGKLPSVMSDLAKGIKAFKSGMREEAPALAEEVAEPAADAPTEQRGSTTATR